MHPCPKCGTHWPTEWLAEPSNCEVCNPYACTWGCGRFYPSAESANDCCRD